MINHVIKLTHVDGKKITPTLWCGSGYEQFAWHFQDAQHVALSSGDGIQPCGDCVNEIIKALKAGL